jgi:hypothetical protein
VGQSLSLAVAPLWDSLAAGRWAVRLEVSRARAAVVDGSLAKELFAAGLREPVVFNTAS